MPRLKDDIAALTTFFDSELPPRIEVRSREIFVVIFGFGDASGGGFGSSIDTGNGICVRVGVWTAPESDNSSNWREFMNVVESLEAEAEKGTLPGTELFFFTDNSTVEAAIFKGSSTSPRLHALVVRFRSLELKCGCRFIISHVAGKRMIAQGTDGISRGAMNEGVMAGHDMLAYVPLHLSAVERQPNLRAWFDDIDSGFEWLTPNDWYQRGHDIQAWSEPSGSCILPIPKFVKGRFVWTPPPAAAEAALEELRKARIKRQESLHIVLVPRLLAPFWRKQLHKACALVFEIPPGSPCWGEEQFEPLLTGVCFPYLSFKPWQLQGTPRMAATAREMPQMWKDRPLDAGPFLRKFFLRYRSLGSLPEHMVRKLLYFEQ